MLTLGIETTGSRLDVALATGEGEEARFWLRAGRQHGRRLAPAVQRLLVAASLQVGDVEAVVVDVGPGSFTGLRIGLTFARALAHARGLPMVGVTALEALAASQLHWPGWVAPTLDARHRRVYAALYRGEAAKPGDVADWAGRAADLEPAPEGRPATYEAGSWAQVLARCEEPVLVVGSGAYRYPDLWRDAVPGVTLVDGEPDAGIVARLGALRLAAGATGEPLAVEAVYLRLTEPERASTEV